MPADIPPPVVPATEALQMLREGNQRFLQHDRTVDIPVGKPAREALLAGQKPFAVVLSCSDSRVPAEIVFDQGLGDLFVVRVAGNIVAPSLVGSIEFAVSTFGTRLVVVMGHTHCGAIKATLQYVLHGTGVPSDNIRDIVERCRAPVATVVSAMRAKEYSEELMNEAVRANIRNACDNVRHGSRMLEGFVRDEGVRIVGAEYALETGVIEFFDGI